MAQNQKYKRLDSRLNLEKIRNAIIELKEKLQRFPTVKEIAAHTNINHQVVGRHLQNLKIQELEYLEERASLLVNKTVFELEKQIEKGNMKAITLIWDKFLAKQPDEISEDKKEGTTFILPDGTPFKI